MTRKIFHLQKALRLEDWPPSIPKPRPRGVKAFGQRYEKMVEKQLPEARRGVWWEFIDANGLGLCQTDFLIPSRSIACILECKNTYNPEAFQQLSGLYLPVVGMALGCSVIGIHVCKNLTQEATGPIAYDLTSAIHTARESGQIVTLHWRGVTPLLKSPTLKPKDQPTWPNSTGANPLQQAVTFLQDMPSGPRL